MGDCLAKGLALLKQTQGVIEEFIRRAISTVAKTGLKTLFHGFTDIDSHSNNIRQRVRAGQFWGRRCYDAADELALLYRNRTARRFPARSSTGRSLLFTLRPNPIRSPFSRTPPWSMSLRAALLVGARPVSSRRSTIGMLAWPFSDSVYPQW